MPASPIPEVKDHKSCSRVVASPNAARVGSTEIVHINTPFGHRRDVVDFSIDERSDISCRVGRHLSVPGFVDMFALDLCLLGPIGGAGFLIREGGERRAEK